MKKFSVFLIFLSLLSYGQSDNNDYNKWSLEVSVGQSKGLNPFTEGYYSSDPTKYINFGDISNYSFASRYMFNDKFGARLGIGYNLFQNQSGSGSLPFEAKMYSMSLSGVMNIGKLLDFGSFTNRFGLLFSTGLNLSQFTPNSGRFSGVTEDNGGITIGLMPQFRISNRISLNANFELLSNFRQHYNWDGVSLASKDANLSGSMFSAGLGLNFYLGNSSVHADWYSSKNVINEKLKVDEEARKRLDEIETMLSDMDKDGVPDYLDFENNTPSGVAVDTRGRFIDVNTNGVPDELESDVTNTSYLALSGSIDVMKNLAENGYLNIFFALNSDVPDESSTAVLYSLLKYMKSNPKVKISLTGYADTRGGSELNAKLSEKRAMFVYDFLINNGIDKSRVAYLGKGVDTSINSGNKDLDYRLSRRVSVNVVSQ